MENNINLDSKEIFSISFANARKHFWKFFAAVLVLVVLSGISPEEVRGPLSFVLAVISVVGTVYVTITMYGGVFKMLSGQEVLIGDMFAWPKNGFKMLWANILSGLAVAPFILLAFVLGVGSFFSLFGGAGSVSTVLGLITLALALVALYLSIRLMFAKYYALDKGAGAVDSIKYSWSITKNNFLRLFWLAILMMCVVFIGILALLVGIFWAIPTVLVAQIVIYKKLSGSMNNPVEVAGGSILPEAQPLELEANPSIIDVQK